VDDSATLAAAILVIVAAVALNLVVAIRSYGRRSKGKLEGTGSRSDAKA
jgi:hypothetical protein